jgi:hypothetical protein
MVPDFQPFHYQGKVSRRWPLNKYHAMISQPNAEPATAVFQIALNARPAANLRAALSIIVGPRGALICIVERAPHCAKPHIDKRRDYSNRPRGQLTSPRETPMRSFFGEIARFSTGITFPLAKKRSVSSFGDRGRDRRELFNRLSWEGANCASCTSYRRSLGDTVAPVRQFGR